MIQRCKAGSPTSFKSNPHHQGWRRCLRVSPGHRTDTLSGQHHPRPPGPQHQGLQTTLLPASSRTPIPWLTACSHTSIAWEPQAQGSQPALRRASPGTPGAPTAGLTARLPPEARISAAWAGPPPSATPLHSAQGRGASAVPPGPLPRGSKGGRARPPRACQPPRSPQRPPRPPAAHGAGPATSPPPPPRRRMLSRPRLSPRLPACGPVGLSFSLFSSAPPPPPPPPRPPAAPCRSAAILRPGRRRRGASWAGGGEARAKAMASAAAAGADGIEEDQRQDGVGELAPRSGDPGM